MKKGRPKNSAKLATEVKTQLVSMDQLRADAGMSIKARAAKHSFITGQVLKPDTLRTIYKDYNITSQKYKWYPGAPDFHF